MQLLKTGIHRYCESPAFEILLFSYSVNSCPVQVADFACVEKIPDEIVAALEDEPVIKWTFNASFERICLSKFLAYPTVEYLEPKNWHCSVILLQQCPTVAEPETVHFMRLRNGKPSLLHYVQLDISIRDLDLLTIKMVNDMYTESSNVEYKDYAQIATQKVFNVFKQNFMCLI